MNAVQKRLTALALNVRTAHALPLLAAASLWSGLAFADTVSATFTAIVLPNSTVSGNAANLFPPPIGQTITGSFSYSTTPISYSAQTGIYELSGSWDIYGYSGTSANPVIAGTMAFEAVPYQTSSGTTGELLDYFFYTPGGTVTGLLIPLVNPISGVPSSLTFSSSQFDPSSTYTSYVSIYGGDYSQMLYLHLTGLNGVAVPSAVPLPASIWLMLSGLVGVGAMARKRRAA